MWCPINPRNEAAENRELLDLFDCSVVVFQPSFVPLVERIRADLTKVHTWVCLDGGPDGTPAGSTSAPWAGTSSWPGAPAPPSSTPLPSTTWP